MNINSKNTSIEQINEDHLVVRSKELMDGIIYFEDLNDEENSTNDVTNENENTL